MTSEIICIGTELLLGSIVNTNASFMARHLASIGIDVFRENTIGDNPKRLAEAIRLAASRSDIVITTGGLGPTVDDITREAISEACGLKLILNKNVRAEIYKILNRKKYNRSAQINIHRMSCLPGRAEWFKNKYGSAVGFAVKCGKALLIALPGPPHEMEPMFTDEIIPYLKKKGYAGNYVIKTKAVRIAGLPESSVNDKVKDLLSLTGRTTVGIYVQPGIVDLKITTKAENENKADKEILKIQNIIKKRIKRNIFGYDNDTVEEALGRKLLRKNKTISVAESCTGGLVGDRITNVSGSSKYFTMGIVAYSNDVKIKLLGVSPETLKKFGAVSKETALEMAEGMRRLSGTDVALAITGIAGPTGRTKEKPVGLVYISVVSGGRKVVNEYKFVADRKGVKFRASQAALWAALRIL